MSDKVLLMHPEHKDVSIGYDIQSSMKNIAHQAINIDIVAQPTFSSFFVLFASINVKISNVLRHIFMYYCTFACVRFSLHCSFLYIASHIVYLPSE